MAKKKLEPKLGEQIVGDLDETIVEDPAPAEEAPAQLSTTEEEELAKILAAAEGTDPVGEEGGPVIEEPSAGPVPSPFTILVEGEGRVGIDHPNNPPGFRVVGLNGFVYDHCAETPEGEWVYRRQ